ncbi:uncharacterized protein LOC130703764 [Daphnia carinata]|uniref:uncharacterized protein LOC130703764 n=1 Tax=Daphnia carinata TaxID=120202 RepID=UPI00257A99D9|nr:uncharacterized protein LOC130703764 [Daphnia carinata]
MEIKSAVIVPVLMAALFVNTFAAYITTPAYSTVAYSEVDSAEQKSHEATYPAKISYGSAAAAYSNSEEESIHGEDEGDEGKHVNVGIEYPTYNEAEYVTTSYPFHIDPYPGDGTVSYTTVAYSAPIYNEPQVAATYTPPDYSVPTYTAPTLDVPIYRSPAVLPYWMRSGYAENSIANNALAY